MKVLVINAGSSSLKYQLMDTKDDRVITKGLCERIGIDGRHTNKTNGKKDVQEVIMKNHSDALKVVMDCLLSDKVKDIFEKLDNEETLLSIKEDNNDINVYIGEENNIDSDVTVIKTNYKTDKDTGTIAIIGPKRMEYGRVVNLLDYIKKQIER